MPVSPAQITDIAHTSTTGNVYTDTKKHDDNTEHY